MNSERLLRHYPELHELPRKTRLALIEKAQADTFGPQQKLANWRKNLVTLAVIASLSLLIVLVLGPALGLSDGAVAGVMMMVVLPSGRTIILMILAKVPTW
jgi:antibiotic biosynthesis monooxygenase (ABM) superfamily enzyme